MNSSVLRRSLSHWKFMSGEPALVRLNRASTRPVITRATLLRILLIAGCAFAIGIGAWVGDPSGYLQSDAALSRLLRCMALIKGAIALLAAAAVIWRFGRAISRLGAFAYAMATWMLAGSAMLIWQLTFIPLAAILFHTAAAAILLLGWRER